MERPTATYSIIEKAFIVSNKLCVGGNIDPPKKVTSSCQAELGESPGRGRH